MKDLYYRAAAELTVASNSGWEYLASKDTPKINEKNRTDIETLPIFTNVLNPLFKTASFFIVLFAGWRLITKLAGNKEGKIFDAFRATFPLLLVAIILWDFRILLSIVTVLQTLAGNLGESISKLS